MAEGGTQDECLCRVHVMVGWVAVLTAIYNCHVWYVSVFTVRHLVEGSSGTKDVVGSDIVTMEAEFQRRIGD